jgi:hypothetical protein
MKHALYLMPCLVLGTALLKAAPADAQGSYYPGPQAEVSSGVVPPPVEGLPREAANLPAGSGNAIPNGPVTSNPPGASASSSAALAEHGEVASSSNTGAGGSR